MDDIGPTEPWLSDVRWRDGRARSSALAELFPWWFCFFCCGALLLPAALVGPEEVQEAGWGAMTGVAVLSLAALFLLVRATSATLEWRKFGRLEVALDPFPGSVGGQVGGTVDVAAEGLKGSDCLVTLSCVEVNVTGHGKRRHRSESTVWSAEQRPVLQPGPGGVRLAFVFDVPDGLPDTRPPARHHHYWAIRIAAALPGLDLDRAIEVPVYKTVEPRLASRTAAPPAPARPATLGGGLGAGIHARRESGGLTIHYAASRGFSTGILALVFGLLFGGGGVWLAAAGVDVTSAAGGYLAIAWSTLAFFVLAFGGIGLAVAAVGVWMLGNSLEVEVDPRQIRTRRRFLGVGCGQAVLRHDEIDRIELVIHSQRGSGARAEVAYLMRALCRDGRSVRIGDGIRGARAAAALGALMQEATGVPAQIVARKRRKRGEKSSVQRRPRLRTVDG